MFPYLLYCLLSLRTLIYLQIESPVEDAQRHKVRRIRIDNDIEKGHHKLLE